MYTSHLATRFIPKLRSCHVSPLWPVIANIFMVESETTLVPKLEDHVKKRGSFVDMFVYVKHVIW